MFSKIKSLFYYIVVYPYYKLILKGIGSRSKIISPLKVYGAGNIVLGKKVIVEYKTWLAAYPHTGAESCSLVIEDGTHIGHFNHIYATSKIHIGKKVLTADKVYISDNLHAYQDINLAVIDQPVKQINEVVIGDGAWIGENVCIIGASVGKGCVIGANAVVTKNIPDFSVAVGNPAQIIKRFDVISNSWLKTKPNGDFFTDTASKA